jgi:PPOX class probable F420-dependent enzyme
MLNAEDVTVALPDEVRALLAAPNYVHLTTLRADGSPRSHVVWVGLDGDQILICTSDWTWKAKDMRRDPRVSLSVVDADDPYRMAAVQGRVVTERPDHECTLMDPIARKYTGAPFPQRGPDRVCFVVAAVRATHRRLGFVHAPAGVDAVESTHSIGARAR